MKDYSKGKVYKIESKDGTHDLVYIGSTTMSIEHRLYQHEAKYKHYLKDTSKDNLFSSYQVLETGDYHIKLLEEYPCNSRKELELRERHYQVEIKCCNKNLAGSNNFTNYENRKESILKYQQSEKYKNYFRTFQRRNYHWKKIKMEFLNILLEGFNGN